MLTRPLLFVSSYAGLFVILMIRFHEVPLLVAGSAAAAIVGLAAPLVLIRSLRLTKRSIDPYRVDGVEDRGSDVSAYLATYLLPFVTVAEPTPIDIAGYALFLFLAGIVYVQSEMVQINPTFYLLRWRMYAVSTTKKRRFYIIAKSRPSADTDIRAWTITDDVLVDVELGGG